MNIEQHSRNPIENYLASWSFRGDERYSLYTIYAASIEILPLLLLFVLLDYATRALGQLPEASYERGWLLPELGKQLFRNWIPLIIILVPLIVGFRNLPKPWTELEQGQSWRLIVTLVSIIIVWPMSTYDVNFYFGQAHNLDRLLLLAMPILIYWRPIFLLPGLLLMYMMVGQFDYPLHNYPWTEMNLILRTMTLALAAIFIKFMTGRKQFFNFCFLLFCLIAAQYFAGGMNKVWINWITHPHVNFLMHGAYAAGWARFLAPETVGKIMAAVSFTNLPLMLFTLFAEAGAVFSLWRRWSFKLFLVSWALLHGGIFIYSGFFFGKWMALEIIVLAVIFLRKKPLELPIFQWQYFMFSVLLIGAGRFWAGPPNLTWFDTPLAYGYEYEVIGESGTTYQLAPTSLSFYQDGFVLGIFDELSDTPQLTNSYAVTNDRWLADELLTLSTAEQVLALEDELGPYNFSEDKVANMDKFMIGYFSNWNDQSTGSSLLSSIPYVPHLWSFTQGELYDGQEPAKSVEIYQNVTFYYEGEIRAVRRTLVHSVEME